jgi:hypothetical protein
MLMKRTVMCDITPCSPLKVNVYFGRKSLLHLRGRKIRQARKSNAVFLLWPWRRRWHVSPKLLITFWWLSLLCISFSAVFSNTFIRRKSAETVTFLTSFQGGACFVSRPETPPFWQRVFMLYRSPSRRNTCALTCSSQLELPSTIFMTPWIIQFNFI